MGSAAFNTTHTCVAAHWTKYISVFVVLHVQYLGTERVFVLLDEPRERAEAVVASSGDSAVCEDFVWKLCQSWAMSDVMQRLLEETPCSDSREQKQREKKHGWTVAHWQNDWLFSFCLFETKCWIFCRCFCLYDVTTPKNIFVFVLELARTLHSC